MIDCEFETNTGESIDSLTPQIIFLCMTIPFNWSGAGDRHMPSPAVCCFPPIDRFWN
jgi:hypothetical protein